MAWHYLFYNDDVRDAMMAMDAAQKDTLKYIEDRLEEFGPSELPAKLSKPLGDGLLEFKLDGIETTARIFYCFLMGSRLVFLPTLVKKTQKTPARDLNWPMPARMKLRRRPPERRRRIRGRRSMLDANKFIEGLASDPDVQAIRRERGIDLCLDLLRARKRAGLTQEEVGEHMQTSKSVISRMEAPWKTSKPSLRTLERFAAATGHRLVITLEPIEVAIALPARKPGKVARLAREQQDGFPQRKSAIG
jgi:phage-related protein/transcriptional regulator with XRE-family HTH domain